MRLLRAALRCVWQVIDGAAATRAKRAQKTLTRWSRVFTQGRRHTNERGGIAAAPIVLRKGAQNDAVYVARTFATAPRPGRQRSAGSATRSAIKTCLPSLLHRDAQQLATHSSRPIRLAARDASLSSSETLPAIPTPCRFLRASLARCTYIAPVPGSPRHETLPHPQVHTVHARPPE